MLISTAVRVCLKRIARDGAPSDWPGFDDADIKWFLDRHKDKDGPTLNWLRREYEAFLNYEGDTGCALFFFPVSQEQAKGLLAETRNVWPRR